MGLAFKAVSEVSLARLRMIDSELAVKSHSIETKILTKSKKLADPSSLKN